MALPNRPEGSEFDPAPEQNQRELNTAAQKLVFMRRAEQDPENPTDVKTGSLEEIGKGGIGPDTDLNNIRGG